MAAGVTGKLWEMSDMVQLLEQYETRWIEDKRKHALEPAGAWE